MLDRATIERLALAPEKNEATVNVVLAEEGDAHALMSLARSLAVGPDALAVIAQRVAVEGSDLGLDCATSSDELPAAEVLDRLLIAHPRAPGGVRDAVLGRHPGDAFFVLAAACHPQATLAAVERAVDWPAASPLHDRIWLPLIDPATVPPLALEAWAQGSLVHRREAAARIARAEGLLAGLGHDRARQVRRAVASNPCAQAERARLAAEDPAPEVRARAASPLPPSDAPLTRGAELLAGEAFTAALQAMSTHGVISPDVEHALSSDAAKLDEQGALLAAQLLPQPSVLSMLDRVLDQGLDAPQAQAFAAGLALRTPKTRATRDGLDAEGEAEVAEIARAAVQSLGRTAPEDSPLTGKARLAAWSASGLARCEAVDRDRMLHYLSRLPLGSEGLILSRAVALRPASLTDLCEGISFVDVVPASLLEIAWASPSVPDAVVLELAARVARPRALDLPEDDVDLDPCRRSLPVLDKVVLATALRANVSPRASLTAVALDPRRVRYVLAAMPQWKGRLTGGRLARVFRQHASALPLAHGEGRPRSARTEPWTERLLTEIELAVALAVGHLTGVEVTRRIQAGRQVVGDGLALSSGAEARAAIEGPQAIQPLLEWAAKNRAAQAAALTLWLLLERFERERGALAVAAALDGFGGARPSLPASVSEALAVLEHREPGRLSGIYPASPQGRAALSAAVARAYRAVGGLHEERPGA